MYFYAAGSDFLDVARLVLDQTDCLLYEADSEINQPLRQVGGDDLGPWIQRQLTKYVGLVAWSPAMRQEMGISAVTLQTTEGGVRQSAVGWGLIDLQLFDIRAGTLARSHVFANSRSRALRWEDLYKTELGPVDAWNWSAVERSLRRIERLIRTSLVVAKEASTPMLLRSRDAFSSGTKLVP